MMDFMVRDIEKRAGEGSAKPRLRVNRASSGFRFVARQSHVFNILAQTLQVARQERRNKVYNEELCPETEMMDNHQDCRPDQRNRRQFQPNPFAAAINGRVLAQETAQKQKRGVKEATRQLH